MSGPGETGLLTRYSVSRPKRPVCGRDTVFLDPGDRFAARILFFQTWETGWLPGYCASRPGRPICCSDTVSPALGDRFAARILFPDLGDRFPARFLCFQTWETGWLPGYCLSRPERPVCCPDTVFPDLGDQFNFTWTLRSAWLGRCLEIPLMKMDDDDS